MRVVSILQDLFDHNDWANQRMLKLCDGLADELLDQPREIGFGSLRRTVFHILEAERLWLGRWLGEPWRGLETDPQGISVRDLAQEFQAVSARRNELLAREQESGFRRVVHFQDNQQQGWAFPIGDLMNHVANHGIHHRAQALNILKSFGRTVPAGLDYLFYKLSRPSCELPAASLDALRQFGLEVALESGAAPFFDRQRIQFYFAHHDWAMQTVFHAAQQLENAQLDEVFDMGRKSLRNNLQHILDAQRWWLANWQADRADFPRGEPPRSIADMHQQQADLAIERNRQIEQLDEESAQRVVYVTAGGPESCFRVVESLLQLCSHGTHHRAQCVNMLRHLGVDCPALDIIAWMRQEVRVQGHSDSN